MQSPRWQVRTWTTIRDIFGLAQTAVKLVHALSIRQARKRLEDAKKAVRCLASLPLRFGADVEDLAVPRLVRQSAMPGTMTCTLAPDDDDGWMARHRILFQAWRRCDSPSRWSWSWNAGTSETMGTQEQDWLPLAAQPPTFFKPPYSTVLTAPYKDIPTNERRSPAIHVARAAVAVVSASATAGARSCRSAQFAFESTIDTATTPRPSPS